MPHFERTERSDALAPTNNSTFLLRASMDLISRSASPIRFAVRGYRRHSVATLRPPPQQVISYLPAPPSTRSLDHTTLLSAPKLTSKSVMPNGFAPNTR